MSNSSLVKNNRRMLRMALAGFLVSVFAGACGSDDGGGASSKACAVGDTRACLGPGQCDGAQACLADGTGYGTCECGAPDSGAGGGGTSGASGAGGGGGGAAPDSSSGATGGSAGVAGTGAAGASGSDAGDGAVTYVDDPCPTGAIYNDCSSTCKTDGCILALCGKGPDKVNEVAPFPLIIRTPASPGTTAPCQCTDSTVSAFSYYLWAKSNGTTEYFRISVGPPWRIYTGTTDNGSACTYDVGASGCVTPSTDLMLFMYFSTDDPDAPMRNITVERSDTPLSCP